MSAKPAASAVKIIYRVTYVDSVFREAFINAASPEAAQEVVRDQMENGAHHHAVDTWNDDWQSVPHAPDGSRNRLPCCECGK